MMISTVERPIRRPQPGMCWVIVDPRLAEDSSLDALRAALARCAILDSVWRQTSEGETGMELATAAVAARAGRVVVVGDEAMIRGVASTLADTGVPLGLVPVGSGRSLARSLGAATDPHDAIAAALGESRSVLDLMKVTIDGDRQLSSFITVGVENGGAAGPWGRRRAGMVGSLGTGPAPRSLFGATATVGHNRPTYTRSAACVIGLGSRVVSGERPVADERILRLSMVRPARRFGLSMARRGSPAGRRVVTTQDGPTGRRVLLVLDEARPYYLDGALAGYATTVSAELQLDALSVLVPA